MSENTIRFNANQAIQSIERLSKSIDALNIRMRTLNKTGDKNRIDKIDGRRAAKSLDKVGKSADTAGKKLAQVGKTGSQAADNLTLSWETFVRVIQTQVIVRALSSVIDAINGASEEAREFQLTIARTAAIADDADFDTLSDSVRQLAVELGNPIGKVAEASFQALQNDIADTTQESLRFVEVANKLASATGSELESSVNALTSILKAYGEENITATQASDILFRSVDVGRISLEELESRLGTITPQAATLGVEFREAAGAVSSLTLAGLDTARASTQLRNIFAKLIRPTTSLQSAFQRLGVTSGKELIAQFGGLQGGLEALLQQGFDGDITALANAFGTIRGQLGVLNLLARDGEEFNRVLTELNDTAGATEAAFEEVSSTTAKQFDRAVADAKDTLLGIGNAFLEVKTAALDVFNFLVPDTEQLVQLITSFGVAAGISWSTFIAGALKAKLALLAVNPPLTLIGLAVGAATFAFIEFADNGIRSVQDLRNESLAAAEKINASFEKSSNKIKSDQEALTKAQQELIKDFVEASRSGYDDARRAFAASSERIEITANRVADDFVDSRKRLVEELRGFVDDIDGRITDSFERVRDAQQDLEELRFENALRGLDEVQKANAELIRSTELAARARNEFAAAGLDESARDAARETQRDAEAQARAAVATAERAENVDLLNRALRTQESIVAQRARLEAGGAQELQGFDQILAGGQIDEIQRLLAQEEVVAKSIAELQNRSDQAGQLRGADLQTVRQINAQIARLEEQRQGIAQQLNDLEIIDVARFREQFNQIERQFQEGTLKARFDLDAAVVELQEQINDNRFRAEIELDAILTQSSIPELQKQLQDGVRSAALGDRLQESLRIRSTFSGDQRQLINDFENTTEIFNNQISSIGTALDNAQREVTGYQNIVGQIFSSETFTEARSPGTVIAEEAKAVAGASASLIVFARGLKELQAQGQVSEDVISGLREELEAINTAIANNVIGGGGLDNLKLAAESAGLAIDRLEESSNLSGQIKATADQLNQVGQESQRAAEKASEIEKNTRNVTQEAGNAATATSTIGAAAQANVTLINNSTTAMTQLKNEALAAGRAIAATGSTQAAAFGGTIKRNFGGALTRGKDTRLVAATPGEFFVNSRSSSQFFSQLQAINAGQNPVFRNQGGPVTNIGDINVSVDARGSRNVDGKVIAESLQRELRRNPGSLRR